MATIQLQLHQSLDGKSFETLKEAKQRNDDIAQEAWKSLRKLLSESCGLSEYDSDLVMDMFIDRRDEILSYLKFLQ